MTLGELLNKVTQGLETDVAAQFKLTIGGAIIGEMSSMGITPEEPLSEMPVPRWEEMLSQMLQGIKAASGETSNILSLLSGEEKEVYLENKAKAVKAEKTIIFNIEGLIE